MRHLLLSMFIIVAALADYTVTNVKSNDHLNMRSTDTYKSEIVGTLAHNELCVQMVLDTPKWVIVKHGDKYGWINKYYLKQSDRMCEKESATPHEKVTIFDTFDHKARISGLALDEKQNLMVSIDQNGFLIVRTLNAKKMLFKKQIPTHGYLKFSPDGKHISTISDQITVYTFPAMKKVFVSKISDNLFSKLIHKEKGSMYQSYAEDNIKVIEGEEQLTTKNKYGVLQQKHHGRKIYHRDKLVYTEPDCGIMDFTFASQYSGERKSVFFINKTTPSPSIYEVSVTSGRKIWHTDYATTAMTNTGGAEPILAYNKKQNLLYALEDFEYIENIVSVWDLSQARHVKTDTLSNFSNIPYIYKYAKCVHDKQGTYGSSKYQDLNCIETSNLPFHPDDYIAYEDNDWVIGSDISINTLKVTYDGSTVFFHNTDKSLVARFLKDETTDTTKDIATLLFTKEGYFAGDSRQQIGIARGIKRVSIDAFYKKFYRPDLVKLVLQGVTIEAGESMADIITNKPAPKLSFIGIKDTNIKTSKEHYSLKIGIKDTGGGIGRVRVYVNNSLVNTSDRAVVRRQKEYDKTFTFDLALSEGQNKVKVLAWNQDESMQTSPLELTIESSITLDAPDLHVLIVGIDEFENPALRLNYAVADAHYFNTTIKEHSKALFHKIHIRSLTSKEETSKASISIVLKNLSQNMKPNDYFLFYISSHGEVEKEKFYLLTSNVLFLDEIQNSAISDDNLIELIGNIPTKNKIVFFDTCYAGDVGAKMASALAKKTIVSNRGLSAKDAIDLLKMESGASIFSASSSIQQAIEGYKGHGLYTYFLVNGLKGKADSDKDGFVDLSELNRYIKINVYKTSKEKYKRAQIPYSNLGIDVPISKVEQ